MAAACWDCECDLETDKNTFRTIQNDWENTRKFGFCPLRSKTLVFPGFFAFLANCFGRSPVKSRAILAKTSVGAISPRRAEWATAVAIAGLAALLTGPMLRGYDKKGWRSGGKRLNQASQPIAALATDCRGSLRRGSVEARERSGDNGLHEAHFPGRCRSPDQSKPSLTPFSDSRTHR